MNFDKIIENIDVIAAATAEAAGVANCPIVRDAVRDTITALQVSQIKEFGGLEKHAAAAIAEFDADKPPRVVKSPKVEDEPAAKPKTKK